MPKALVATTTRRSRAANPSCMRRRLRSGKRPWYGAAGKPQRLTAEAISSAPLTVPVYTNARPSPGSSYCPDHHAICRLAIGSRAERSEIRLVEWIGEQVGGRTGDRERVPPEKFMRRLEGRRR